MFWYETVMSRMTSAQKNALALSLFTVAYNVLEGAVSIIAASLAGSTALLGFGLDSFIESLSGTVMVWRFWQYGVDADDPQIEAVEQKAARLVAYSFFILGGYVAFDAGLSLYHHEEPEVSFIGMAVAIASIVIMPMLFWVKYRLGKRIGSLSLVADSKQTLACVILSVALLIGLVLNAVFGFWWADSAAALVIAVLIFQEGRETLEESRGG